MKAAAAAAMATRLRVMAIAFSQRPLSASSALSSLHRRSDNVCYPPSYSVISCSFPFPVQFNNFFVKSQHSFVDFRVMAIAFSQMPLSASSALSSLHRRSDNVCYPSSYFRFPFPVQHQIVYGEFNNFFREITTVISRLS